MTSPAQGQVTTAVEHYDRLLAEHYTWMLGGDIPALARAQRAEFARMGVEPGAAGRVAVDLGCGPGHASLALAGLGFDPVLAVDLSQPLLDEVAQHAAGLAAVRPVRADIRTALRELVAPGSAGAVVCLGDTLTHLPTRGDVAALVRDIAAALAPGGVAVLAYRDLSRPLTGTDRFVPVRTSEDRIMTCFLEYPDDFGDYTVVVHDLVHQRRGPDWTLRAGSYRKLRLAHAWVLSQCLSAGLRLVRESAEDGTWTVVLRRDGRG
ncbi:bifunctional 2-polyprenyl-6-hydroxyphenol methylase/3-demethylubiquinol 3-O-methyltransferase UbiG [Streptomyces sp. 7-21]|uniref:class I SAM-dependent methyltransferase n=1 Tax=Streptomyces sp. 7-21 TaxID=2802283 RepID=UPI00191DCEB4|nr:class I SAM-dependent methyltransferase [Streptomyces sp. 7-21]MBL1067175.1 class I SAM-dependent methyltransferase [Streptomyces sp. 7-21]